MAAPPVKGWESQILHGVGAPVTAENVKALHAWLQAEGGSAANNPFNTTQPAQGATSYNSVGVRNYVSPQQGIAATVQTLLNGRYGNVVAALRHGGSAVKVGEAIAASPWGTGSGVLRVLGAGNVSTAPVVGPAAKTAAVPDVLGLDTGTGTSSLDALVAVLLGRQFQPPQVQPTGVPGNPSVHIETPTVEPGTDHALQLAQDYMAATQPAFTNPGLARYLHGLNGIPLPASTAKQAALGEHTDTPRAGDVAFFGSPPSHQAVMVGPQTGLHFTDNGHAIRVSAIGAHPYASALTTVRRY